MIKVLLTGGLGNQMFQYAFGRALSVKDNTNLVLSTAYLQSKLPIKKMATQMKYELDIFNVKAKVESNLFSGKILYPISKIEYLIKNKINEIKLNTITEERFSFQSALLETTDNCYLKGNFQSQKYFKSIEAILREEFIFKNLLDEQNVAWINEIENCNSVSIHVRRGDYISLKQNVNKFAQIPIAYYQNAIHHIASKIEHPIFFIFSDDINWTKENIRSDFPFYFVENNNTSETSYIDMQLMALCKHNIICNSTFSWWSAWLNNNPQKMVIAPQNWFSDVSINSQDIIPDEWIKL